MVDCLPTLLQYHDTIYLPYVPHMADLGISPEEEIQLLYILPLSFSRLYLHQSDHAYSRQNNITEYIFVACLSE